MKDWRAGTGRHLVKRQAVAQKGEKKKEGDQKAINRSKNGTKKGPQWTERGRGGQHILIFIAWDSCRSKFRINAAIKQSNLLQERSNRGGKRRRILLWGYYAEESEKGVRRNETQSISGNAKPP